MESAPQTVALRLRRPRRASALRVCAAKLAMTLVYFATALLVSYVKRRGPDAAWQTLVGGVRQGKGYLRSGTPAEADGAPRIATKHALIAEGCICSLSQEADGFDGVGGCDAIKAHMRAVAVAALRRPDIFFSASLPQLAPARRFLFCGPPGTGKTMVARAVAADGNALFMNVTLSTIEDKYFGETPKILRAVFAVAQRKARTTAPVVLMFDELDGIMRARREDDQAATYGMKTEMLRLLDTLCPTDRVVLIACTNHERSLDAAVRRRFGTTMRFATPDDAERRDIVRRVVCRHETLVDEECLERLVLATSGMTGSGIADMYQNACGSRVRRMMASGVLSEDARVEEVRASVPTLSIEDFVGERSGGSSTDVGEVEQREEEEEESPPP